MRILIAFILCTILPLFHSYYLNVDVSNSSINAVNTYTFTFLFLDNLPKNITINFPGDPHLLFPNLTITVNSAASPLSASLYNVDNNNKNIFIQDQVPLANFSLVFTITNIKNPHSVTTKQFTANIQPVPVEGLTGSSPIVNYQEGTLTSCVWRFNGTTGSSNSFVVVDIKLANQLKQGNNILVIQFPTSYEDTSSNYPKGLIPTVINTGITYSINNGGSWQNPTAVVSIAATKIQFNFSLTTNLIATSIIKINITNINNPPTQSPTGTNFKVTTQDTNGYFVDTINRCNIDSLPALQVIGTFNPSSSAYVNDPYNNPTITVATLVPFSIETNDIMILDHNELMSISNSSVMQIQFRRKITVNFTYDTLSTQTSTAKYFKSNKLDDGQNTTSMTFKFTFNIRMPPSQKPWDFMISLKRNTGIYAKIKATLSANPLPLNTSLVNIAGNSSQMSLQSNYTLNLTLERAISRNGKILLGFSTQYTLAAGSCTAYVNGNQITSNSNCDLITNKNGSNWLSYAIGQVSTATINAGSMIRIQYPSSLIGNPLFFKTYTFKLQVYYTQLNDSLVQYASSFGSITTSTYNTNNAFIVFRDFMVYDSTTVTVNYTNKVFIPSSSSIQFTFPSQFFSVSFLGKIFIQNVQITNIFPQIDSTTKRLRIIINQDVQPSSKWSIPILTQLPSITGFYPSITMKVNKSSIVYEQLNVGLAINVNLPSTNLTASIRPKANKLIGATTTYQLVLISQVPFPSNFLIYLTAPSIDMFSSPLNCLSMTSKAFCSNTSITRPSGSLFILNITSTYTLSDSYQQFTFQVSSIKNPRSIAPISNWTVEVKALFNTSLGSVSIDNTSSSDYIDKDGGLVCLLSPTKNYYKSNTQNVLIGCSFYNNLNEGDVVEFKFTDKSYSLKPSGTLTCTSSTATNITCSISSSSTTSTLIIQVRIQSTPTSNLNLMDVQFSGLISNNATSYTQNATIISVNRYDAKGFSIDKGTFLYDINCNQALNNIWQKQCKTCNTTVCLTCHTGMYLLNSTKCVSNCPVTTDFTFFSNNGSFTCQPCISPCSTCQSSTKCKTCINTTKYYLLKSDSTCVTSCPTSLNPLWIDNISNPKQQICDKCLDQCLSCYNSSIYGCKQCNSSYVLQKGQCKKNCTYTNTFILNGECVLCNDACQTCNGTGANKCILCKQGYYLDNTYCVSSCPSNKFLINNTYCGCLSNCLTCTNTLSTFCTSCINGSHILFNGSCLTSCPLYTYLYVNRCIQCPSNCVQCISQTSCLKCITGFYFYQSKCYMDCNTISYQFHFVGNICVLCPTGCDTCVGTVCSTCLDGYTKVGNECVKACSLTNSCTVQKPPVPDSVLAIPGSIGFFIWMLIVIGVKYFVPKLYVPYAMIFATAAIQFFLIISTTIYSHQLSLQTSKRLLAVDYSYRPTIFSLLVVALVINYITNAVFGFLFYKYLLPLMKKPKQIDYITMGSALVFGLLTNYRFCLIIFSKMFPKPHIQIDIASRLTPIHYLCVVSLLFSGLSLAASGLIIKNQYALTDIFMLGIDILIIQLILIFFTVWMISCDKPPIYYESQIKKYETQQTLEGQKDQKKEQKNVSHLKLMFGDSNLQNKQHNQFEDSVQFDKRLLDRFSTINITKDYIPESDNQKPLSNKLSRMNKVDLSNVKATSVNRIANSMDITDISALANESPKNKRKNKLNQQNQKIPTKKGKQNVIDYEKREQKLSNTNQKMMKFQTQDEDNLPKTLQKKQNNSSNILGEIHQPSSDDLPNLPLRDSVFPQKSDFGSKIKPKKQLNKMTQRSQIIKNNKSPLNKSNSQRQVESNDRSYAKTNMKKKNKFFQSQVQAPQTDGNRNNQFDIQQLDIDSIIRSKIIVIGQKDRNSDNQDNNISKIQKREEQNSQANQQISPSWFNVQNQRFDFSSQDSDFSEN